jgi:hypothetical protein
MTDISVKSPLPALASSLRKVRPYVGVLLFLLFAIIYGYMVLSINKLSNPVIDPVEVTTEAKASPSPRLDAHAAEQLQTLKDNSVNVQTLFEQSRTNPFQE